MVELTICQPPRYIISQECVSHIPIYKNHILLIDLEFSMCLELTATHNADTSASLQAQCSHPTSLSI
jgi:hypothetical protein